MQQSTSGSLYFATDKNIFDIMNSRSVSLEKLRSILLSKGIVLSPKASKAELVEYLKSFQFDFFDRQKLLDCFSDTQKKENRSYRSFSANIDTDTITDVLRSITDHYSELSESLDFTVINDNEISIKLSYDEIDYTKTELRQRSNTTNSITLLNQGGVLKVQIPSNEKSIEFTQILKSKIIEISGKEEIEEVNISLEGIASPKKRTKFFLDLIQGIEGYKFDDVKNVSVSSQNRSEEDDESTTNSFINRVILKGQGVLNTDTYGSLNKKGFYISKVIWTVRELNRSKSDFYELTAEFGLPDSCNEFKYSVNGFYRYDEENNSFYATRYPLSRSEIRRLSQLVEASAETAYNNAISED